MIISSHFSEPFSFVVINEKPLKKVVTKKVTKRLDVTIDITLKDCYIFNVINMVTMEERDVHTTKI